MKYQSKGIGGMLLKETMALAKEAEVFKNLPQDEVDEYDKQFPYMEKRKLSPREC